MGFWNDERLAHLEKEWQGGKRSSREIAVDFGCSRNSVMGAIFRHQFKREVTDAQRTIFQNKSRRKRKTDRVYPQQTIARRRPVPTELYEPSEHAVGFFEAGADQCRYVLHPADPNVYYLQFCGAPTHESPWCDYHASICWERPHGR